MSYFAVATYYRDQSYGGPEEGGWWYSTYELEDVVAGDVSEEIAWDMAQHYNEFLQPDEQPRATVVELGRWELKPEYRDYGCHGGDELWDEDGNVRPEYRVQRWDVPEYMPEHRPHYC
jgi:hypothetical protein